MPKAKSKPEKEVAPEPTPDKNEPSVEDIYKKKSLHDHVLALPDTYIGSVNCDTMEMWVFDRASNKIVCRDITFPPGLYKITDEIYVNARDHRIRDPTCKNIKVVINKAENTISVYNDGNGIDVAIHKELNIYVPEMIFGHLLTSSNYEVKGKTVGGKNGMGGKANNIFSKRFEVETVDKKRRKKYYQMFEDNMYTIHPPVITDVTAKTTPYTKITFKPDLARFGLTELTDDVVSLLEKRVYDMAACTCTGNSASVYLNDKLIKMGSFEDYVKMYYQKMPSDLVYQEFNERWRVGVVFDRSSGFRQVSFVNGICTYQGGTHVNHVLDQITKELTDHIKEKNKDIKVKPSYIRDNITLFLDSVIVDPSFSSQTKELLTSKVVDFGSKCEVTADFIKRIVKTGLVDEVVKLAEFKREGELAKTDYKKSNNIKSIEKLDDAHWAGTRKSKLCRLILTEGDSAKAFAVSGLDVVGRERFGVFPLRGKFLNVREATIKQLLNNEEFYKLKQILGLKQGKKYTDTAKLRYGGIIILTDQDVDGSHIKGLIINMLHHFWPSLLKLDGYIQCMSTPIIKAFKKSDSKKKNPACFYTMTAYRKWVETELAGDTSKHVIKYYKGLGTSTEKEAKDVFNDFENRLVKYVWETADGADGADDAGEGTGEPAPPAEPETEPEGEPEDGIDEESSQGDGEEDLEDVSDLASKSHDAITLAFEGLRANDRKNWLFHYDRNSILNIEDRNVTYSDFINKEFIHFSTYNNHRSIPSLIDGLKPSQRKILFGCFKRKIENEEVKVAQLGAYVAEHTLYHHGENSLYGTIVNMAQTFVGSNNVNLLLPNGNFGSRKLGGKDAASPRYIFTQLNRLTPLLFRKDDEPIYTYVDEDGVSAEPERYAPILPFVLVNGVEGIGTGFRTLIPPYNPRDIVKNIKLLLNDEDPEEMIPWFRGFRGSVKTLTDGKIQTTGIYEVVDDTTVRVTELPIGYWTDSYKEFLDGATVPKDSAVTKTKFVEKVIPNSGNNSIDFTITLAGNSLQQMIKDGTLEKRLKLTDTISINNMYLYNTKEVITKYVTAEDILLAFYKYRLDVYARRKEYVLRLFENELKILEGKVRFIEYVLDDKIVVARRDEEAIIGDLRRHGFEELSHTVGAEQVSFRYLTDMKLFSLTNQRVRELRDERDKKRREYEEYRKMTIKDLWSRELDQFLVEYEGWVTQMEQEDADVSGTGKKKGKGRGKGKATAKVKATPAKRKATRRTATSSE